MVSLGPVLSEKPGMATAKSMGIDTASLAGSYSSRSIVPLLLFGKMYLRMLSPSVTLKRRPVASMVSWISSGDSTDRSLGAPVALS